MKNRQMLHTLLQQNPTTYKKFLVESIESSIRADLLNASVVQSSAANGSKGSTQTDDTYTCEDHEIQDPLTYRYNFKATTTDGPANAEFTFFTNAGEKITGHLCSQLAQKYKETGYQ
ncbi:nucleic acid-binding, OB-fold protein [Tanacetum coccineum]